MPHSFPVPFKNFVSSYAKMTFLLFDFSRKKKKKKKKKQKKKEDEID